MNRIPSILPSPRRVKPASQPADARFLSLPSECPFDRSVLLELWGEAAGSSDGREGAVVFRKADGHGEEGYLLLAGKDRIEIVHSAPRGAYYGFVTLTELMKADGGRVAFAEIEDGPAMPVRAVTDDISRGQIPTLATFKAIVKRLSLFKINVYMPYIEDALKFESHPDIGMFSDPVPPGEWRELIAFARSHFVDVRPIFNTLGHWDKMAPLVRYRDLMLKPPPTSKHQALQVLDPLNPAVRPMLEELLGEVVAVFGPGLVHAGGDEPMHLTEFYGREKSPELYTDHYRWVHGVLKDAGCTMAMYSDVFTPVWGKYAVGVEAAKKLPGDVKMVYWNYNLDSDYEGLPELIDAFETHISPSTHNCVQLAPNTGSVYANAEQLAAKAAGRAAGIMMSNWGDGTDCMRESAWPGYAIGSEFGWSVKPLAYGDLMCAFFGQFFGLGPEFDSSRVDAIYRPDAAFGMPGSQAGRWTLWRTFWRDARRPVDEELKRRVVSGQAAIEEAHEYIKRFVPRLNAESWACQEYSARREEFACRKLLALSAGSYATREEAKRAAPAIRELAVESRMLLEEARRRWFASNRMSQWRFVEAKYLDLAESLESLSRYSEECVHYSSPEKFLLSQYGA